jgi:hypothetical protein
MASEGLELQQRRPETGRQMPGAAPFRWLELKSGRNQRNGGPMENYVGNEMKEKEENGRML